MRLKSLQAINLEHWLKSLSIRDEKIGAGMRRYAQSLRLLQRFNKLLHRLLRTRRIVLITNRVYAWVRKEGTITLNRRDISRQNFKLAEDEMRVTISSKGKARQEQPQVLPLPPFLMEEGTFPRLMSLPSGIEDEELQVRRRHNGLQFLRRCASP